MKTVKKFPRKVREIENAWIPMSDGCRLAARIWLPEDAETSPVPAVLEYIPYRKRDFTAMSDALMHLYFAGHGYAGVRVDMRGSGESDGLLLDEYLRQEQDDACEVIAWIATQPWCTGAIGMMGISWGGFNSLQVAARRPPELKAIITVCSTDDRYADDIHCMGGCLLNDNLMWGSTMVGFNSRPPDPALVGDRWREMWRKRLEGAVLFPELWMRHPRRDAIWKHGSVCEDFGAIRCPVYAVGGWADAYTSAVFRLMAGLEVPRKALIGPWGHNYPHSGRPGPAIGFLQEALRWWDHWLKGKDTGIMDEPMVKAWMQESTAPKPQYAERPGRWVAEPSWPSPAIEPRRLVLNPGSLGETALNETRLKHRSLQTVGVTAGEWCPYGYLAEMPTDQREEDGNSLSFDSEPLADRLEILGTPVATLDLAVDRPFAFVAVRLNDVAPDGASTRVTYGLLNLTHRNSHEEPEALEPGRRHTVTVTLNAVAHAFPAGHRVRIAISTAYWPLVWPSPEPVTLTLFTGASSLELPIRPPRPEDEALPSFPPPETAPPLERTEWIPYHRARTIRREVATGETEVACVKNRGHYRLEAIGLEVSAAGTERYRIKEDDPLSAQAEGNYDITLARGDWRIRTEVRTLLTATKEAFLITASLDAYEDESRVFAKRWEEVIPRDLV